LEGERSNNSRIITSKPPCHDGHWITNAALCFEIIILEVKIPFNAPLYTFKDLIIDIFFKSVKKISVFVPRLIQ